MHIHQSDGGCGLTGRQAFRHKTHKTIHKDTRSSHKLMRNNSKTTIKRNQNDHKAGGKTQDHSRETKKDYKDTESYHKGVA